MTAHRLISPRVAICAIATLLIAGSGAQAQVAFPAPLPGQAAPANASPFPPVNGATGAAMPSPGRAPSAFPSGGVAPLSRGFSAPSPQPPAASADAQKCSNDFVALRKEAERRAEVIKGLGKRKASAAEACKAIGNFSQAEIKMIKYVETNAQKCNIPEQLSQQMAAGHKNTAQMQSKVCGVAAQQQEQQQRGPAGPSLSEVLGSTSLPEAKPSKRGGGSTFDTLSGNVLDR